jgi:phage FluMu gp28-like protein
LPSQRKNLVPLTRFQKAWIGDHSRYKLAVKSRRIGFTFGTTLEMALDCVAHSRTRWLIISRTQDTAKEAARECAKHLEAMAAVEKEFVPAESGSGLFLDGLDVRKFVITLPNRSEIMAMTAHPDAARGFGGHVLLDEFGFTRTPSDSYELWKGASAATMRGHRLIVISTPHYQQGKYFELARAAGMTLGHAPAKRQNGLWSCHWVDIHEAAPQLHETNVPGWEDVPKALAEQRELAGQEAWEQEYCCAFLSASEQWIPLELIAAARSPLATKDWDPDRPVEGWLYLGADIGQTDLFAVYINEKIGDVSFERGLITLRRAEFETMENVISAIAAHPRFRRGCVDEGGMGAPLVERLKKKHGSKIEGVKFNLQNKEDMAVLTRKRYEERLIKIDGNDQRFENSVAKIKRQTTSSGNIRFDAARTAEGHADEAIAQWLAENAADSGIAPAYGSVLAPSARDAVRQRASGRQSVWDVNRDPYAGRGAGRRVA